jgi:hypothetical protein
MTVIFSVAGGGTFVILIRKQICSPFVHESATVTFWFIFFPTHPAWLTTSNPITKNRNALPNRLAQFVIRNPFSAPPKRLPDEAPRALHARKADRWLLGARLQIRRARSQSGRSTSTDFAFTQGEKRSQSYYRHCGAGRSNDLIVRRYATSKLTPVRRPSPSLVLLRRRATRCRARRRCEPSGGSASWPGGRRCNQAGDRSQSRRRSRSIFR